MTATLAQDTMGSLLLVRHFRQALTHSGALDTLASIGARISERADANGWAMEINTPGADGWDITISLGWGYGTRRLVVDASRRVVWSTTRQIRSEGWQRADPNPVAMARLVVAACGLSTVDAHMTREADCLVGS